MKNVKVSKILSTASLQHLSADGSSVVLNGSRGLGSDKLGWS